MYRRRTAFLHGELDTPVYVRPPSGVDDGTVWKLQKALYGLKQAPRQWNHKLHETLLHLGFTQCFSDPCLYSCRSLVYVAVYVDDILIVGDSSAVGGTKRSLSSVFTMTDGGQVSWLLGMAITRGPGGFRLSQEHAIINLLQQHNGSALHPVTTPFDMACSTVIPEEQSSEQQLPGQNTAHYRSLIGSMQFLVHCTRPDIAAAVGKLARSCSNPSESDWQLGSATCLAVSAQHSSATVGDRGSWSHHWICR